jgi:hypothetical protein
MFRPSVLAAWLFACCIGSAQMTAHEPSETYPITATPEYAGIYDMATGTWLSPSQGTLNAGPFKVFNNTLPGGGLLNLFLKNCEDIYDEGRIPSPGDPMAPPGASVDNLINLFEFRYCTTALTGTVDIKIAFWNSLGGNCVGGAPPTPPPISTTATAFFDFGAPMGFPLPGSATGTQKCVIVGIVPANPFCMLSDGDGVFDNDQILDNFTWTFQYNGPGSYWVGRAGDPMAAAPGTCTYNIAGPACPATYGLPAGSCCGTGLGSNDNFWVNMDNTPVGQTSTSCPPAGSLFSGGTGCYFFGGYPTNTSTFSSLYMRLESAGSCTACTGNVGAYCTAKVNSSGCTPSINFTGAPSATAGSGFTIGATNILNAKFGLFFYSKSGQQAVPFQGGTLCAKAPLIRTSLQSSGGTAPCGGTFNMDFNAYIASGKDPGLVPGTAVDGQYWSRDPGFAPPNNTNLTNGLHFVICP